MQDLRQPPVDDEIEAMALDARLGGDQLDEIAQRLARLASLHSRRSERLRQLLDVPPLSLGDAGMCRDRRDGLTLLKLAVETRTLTECGLETDLGIHSRRSEQL